MVWLRHIVLTIIGVTVISFVAAEEAGKPFSAIAVQITPQGVTQTRISMSKNAMRNEYEQNGHQFIEIIYANENRRVILFPEQKVFIEQYAPAFPDRRWTTENSPCEKMPGTLCRKIADEVVNGIETEKWEFSRVENGRPVHTLHWIDRKRSLPLREFFADGSVVEMFLLGEETVNDRRAEKWRMQIMAANGQRRQFLQWYDTELKLVIREEHPDGYTRELRDIKVGEHEKGLFQVPEGYQRRAQPPRMGLNKNEMALVK